MSAFGNINLKHAGWGVAVFGVVLALVAGVFLVAENQRSFELDRWQARLRAGAVEPAGRVGDWVADSRRQLRSVAVNPTVQIYLAERATAKSLPRAAPEEQAQTLFLQSYVASLGASGAFAATDTAGAGLAILDARRRVVAATAGYLPPPRVVEALIATLKNGEAGPSVTGVNGMARSVFLAAVLPLQGFGAAPIGYVVGERAFGAVFWASDGSPVAIDGGHESLISVGRNGRLVLLGTSSAAPGRSAQSGEFAAARTPLRLRRAADLAGNDALHLGVAVKEAPWVLVESVPAKAALAGVEDRIRGLILILLLALAAIIAAILALWRHAAGQQMAAARAASVKLYRGVAELLLLAIDQRDPRAAAHSHRVGCLSRAVAARLGQKGAPLDAIELAGVLLNVGKLFVPAALLTKSEALEAMERRQFEEGSSRWLDLLRRMPCELPLEEILHSAYGLMQGNRGLAHPGAFIIAACNMAVALTSARAYRPAYPAAEALRILSGCGIAFPVPVLTALADALAKETWVDTATK